jgi:hypothetical protein
MRSADDVKRDPRPGDVVKGKDGTVYRVFGNSYGIVSYWVNAEITPDTVTEAEWRSYSIQDEVLHVAQ